MSLVSSTTGSQHMTLAEYLQVPTDAPRAELIYGEWVVCPSPTVDHQDIVHDLSHLLRAWVKSRDLGRVSHDLDMVLDDLKDLVYRPDVLFVTKTGAARWQQGRVFGAADLCVEVLSPSDRPRIQRRKFADYERYGVNWYWIIDPVAGTLEENQLVEDSFVCRTEVRAEDWFQPGIFPELEWSLGPLLTGDLKAAVRGATATIM